MKKKIRKIYFGKKSRWALFEIPNSVIVMHIANNVYSALHCSSKLLADALHIILC